MPLQNRHPRWRCVSLEENLDDVDAVTLAASDASAVEQDGSVLGKGDTFNYLSMYRPRRTVYGSSHRSASAAIEAAAIEAVSAEDQIMSSSSKRQPSSIDLDHEIKMAPPKKMSRKKNQTRITEFHVDDGLIYPTHLQFTQSPRAPKKVSRTKRRVLCSVIGCSDTSFHNGGMCFNHGGNRSINPINLFSAHQTQRCVAGDAK
eukprot:scaffold4629_cov146-Skeletonema_menzelii.AAC.4